MPSSLAFAAALLFRGVRARLCGLRGRIVGGGRYFEANALIGNFTQLSGLLNRVVGKHGFPRVKREGPTPPRKQGLKSSSDALLQAALFWRRASSCAFRMSSRLICRRSSAITWTLHLSASRAHQCA